MFAWLKERKTRHGQADKLYGSIVAQARQPAFYSHLGVPDSLEGRYEMIVLHLFLAMDACRQKDTVPIIFPGAL